MVEHDGPCPCGRGRIEIVFWSPNHSFGRGRWDADLRCPPCRGEYVLRQRHGVAWLELRSELQERDTRCRRQSEAFSELLDKALLPLARAIEDFAKRAGRTLKDWHSVVSPAFGGVNIEVFRREVRATGNFGEWVVRRVTPSAAAQLAEAFSIPAPQLPGLLTAFLEAEEHARRAVVDRIELPT